MKKQLSLIALAFIVIFSACKKDKMVVPENTTNVYIAGTQDDSITGNDKSGVWKNGTFTANTITNTNRNHYAYAIAVSGNDVYTTGYENTPTVWKCHVWKNGQLQYSLGDGYSYGNGIAVSGTDVFVAGFAYEQSPLTRYAMLWKNSNGPVNILASGANGYIATAIAVSGNDVYVGGEENDNGRVWKNGVPLTLNNAAGCYITGVAADGADVYAVGYTPSPVRIRSWKNGNSIDIATAGTTFANAIAISNNDVYIAGSDYSGPKAIAKYWKNGVAVTLGDGIRHSKANAIAINGTDVYVAGEVMGANNISDYATVWKNGQATTIGTANSSAKAIVVK
jgi:hypothetical protein